MASSGMSWDDGATIPCGPSFGGSKWDRGYFYGDFHQPIPSFRDWVVRYVGTATPEMLPADHLKYLYERYQAEFYPTRKLEPQPKQKNPCETDCQPVRRQA